MSACLQNIYRIITSFSHQKIWTCKGGENFALRVSVDNHRLLIISTDGIDTEPLLVDSVIIHLGERYDAIPIPKKEGDAFTRADGNHWIRARTLETDEEAQVSS